jgi:SAM-dependent methyltransferase
MNAIETGCTRRTALVFGLACGAAARAHDGSPLPSVPYLSTPMDVVQRMLDLGRVGSADTVFDLGCGDGRIVITAAAERGARGVGIDINPNRIAEAKANAARAGITDRVRFDVANLFETDFSAASVVTLYLLPELNAALRPRLWRQLAVGARVVSHMFDMGVEWPAESTERVGSSRLYQWTMGPEQKLAVRRS